jgi:glycosyltransferase involved in cell wall biosynthesis
VACDDCSTDRTTEILGKFKDNAPFPVRVVINEHRLGFRRNFEKALSLCREDLIAFSDQDDIWLPEKLKEVEKVFLDYPSAGYVFNDGFVVDERLDSRGFSLWNYYGFSFNSTRRFPPGEFTGYCLNRVILGATITMNVKLRDYLLPFPDHWAHDSWVSFAGSLAMEVVALPNKLQKYRQHSNQLYGASLYSAERYKLANKVGRSCFLEQAIHWKEGLARLSSDPRITIDQDMLKEISDKIEHLEIRGNLKGSIYNRLLMVIKEIANNRYHRHSNGWRSVARDLLLK